MTITFGVLSLDSEFVAGSASYFEPSSWLSSFGLPSFSDDMSDGVATFALNATNSICVRAHATNGDILRTGVQPASVVGEVENGVLELPYVIYPLEESLSFADLAGGIPPISQGGLTVSNISVGRSGQNLVATGDASYSTGVVGNVTGDFSYEFRLDPVTSATSASILRVETVDIDLNLNGLLGWLLNGVIDLLLNLFEDRIGDELEAQVQDQIDTAIADRLNEQGDVPPNIQATVQNVVLSADTATVHALVAVPARVIDCPFNVADGSLKIRRGEQLRKLRRLRSLVLRGNPRGDVYIGLMKRHGPELARIIRRNRSLLKKFDALVAAGLDDFDEERPGAGKLKKRTATKAHSLAEEFAEHASPALRRAIEAHRSDIDDFVGTPIAKVLEESAAEAAKLTTRR